jgi:hypothetical protein
MYSPIKGISEELFRVDFATSDDSINPLIVTHTSHHSIIDQEPAIHLFDILLYSAIIYIGNKEMTTMNPYRPNQAGYRKWKWVNEQRDKAQFVGFASTADVCGSRRVYKYRGKPYCGRCGSRLAKEK